MCGRFIQIANPEKIKVELPDLEVGPEVAERFWPRYNVAPTQGILTVLNASPPHLVYTRWGLIPFWAKDPSIGAKLINARAETVAEKPSFKNAFLQRRCLIPADGFYEWKAEGKKKIPYSFSLKTGTPFVFAGLHEKWIAPDEKTVETCTIITTQANSVVEPIHDRMPVIVPKESQTLWLETQNNDVSKLQDILKPYPADEMICEPANLKLE